MSLPRSRLARVQAARSTYKPTGDLEALARAAVRLVKPGYKLGLGTGRAASAFIRALGASGISVVGVPTSRASEELARSVGIRLTTLAEAPELDMDFDGADEVDSRLNLTKGYGGALVREKIIAVASRRRIILVGVEKMVRRLGSRGSLPVEVVPFGVPLAARLIGKLGLKPRIRVNHDGGEFVTDNGNLILDCALAPISNPVRLERQLLAIPGVVGTGLFIGIADTVLVAAPDGEVTTLRRRR
jgi:ribose 5-phosphate isomerase A